MLLFHIVRYNGGWFSFGFCFSLSEGPRPAKGKEKKEKEKVWEGRGQRKRKHNKIELELNIGNNFKTPDYEMGWERGGGGSREIAFILLPQKIWFL